MKFPEPGKVKTRLAPALGEAGAEEVYRLLTRRVFTVLERLAEVAIRVLFDPPERAEEIRQWVQGLTGRSSDLKALEFSPQAPGDLGARLEGAFESGFGDGYEAVAAVGTDCVDISEATFSKAWEELATCDVVLGPTHDGGYYLIALKELHRELFRGIPWSSRETLAASVAAAEKAGLRVGLLEVLQDVDTIEDWKEVEGRV